MSYTNLLSSSRRRTSGVKGRDLLNESESDRGRVLFSPAFRRLQQKAQVFSMEPNASVRSRLTHSLEVAQIGRYIANLISHKLLDKNMASPEQCYALVNFVETACLMHDIGNPPFGHFGEAAIQKWFDDKGTEVIKKAVSPTELEATQIDKALADFIEFDGNPQGLRVVTRLQWNSDEYGLNLTKTALASYLKYLRKAQIPISKQDDDEKPFLKKAGYFLTEEDIINDIWSHFEYNTSMPQRFPLAYIMEAADDIAYCVSDVEDSIEKGLLDVKFAFNEIQSMWEISKSELEKKLEQDKEKLDINEKQIASKISALLEKLRQGRNSDGKDFTFTDFRTSLNRLLVEYSVQQYIENHGSIISGKHGPLIPKFSAPGRILDVLKNYCRKNVYIHESVQKIELAGYTAISGLLNHFRELLETNKDRFDAALKGKNEDSTGAKIITEKKFLSLFPKRHIKVYEHHVNNIYSDQTQSASEHALLEWNARAHLIVDFISGMTDDFAMTTFRTFSGMQL